MRKNLISVFLTIIFGFNSYGCINSYYSLDKSGHFHESDNIHVRFNKNFNKRLIAGKLPKLEQELQFSHFYQKLSDYAVFLLKIGKKEEALDLFKVLHAHHPKEYQIAANLGTAFEVNGQVDSALFYIQLAMELNPDSHGGSEWVHIRVLETKQQIARDSMYLDKYSVLNLTEAEKEEDTIRQHILTQVRERFPFSPGPNPIMASLTYDLADCYSNTSSIEYAKALYNVSSEYFGKVDPTVLEKIKEMIALREEYKEKRPVPDHSDGMTIKVSGIPYKTIIDNNDNPPYEVDWTKINTDVSSLISMVDWALEEFEGPFHEEEPIVHEESTTKISRDSIMYFGFIGAFFLLCLVYIRNRKS